VRRRRPLSILDRSDAAIVANGATDAGALSRRPGRGSVPLSPRRRVRRAEPGRCRVDVEAFELDDLLAARAAGGGLYHEFLRVPALSGGVYVLPAGGADPQVPHREDEVYVVLSGRASIAVGDEDRAVAAGSVVYVPAEVPHRFHDVVEELAVLVLFAPAETDG
jgi:hypothetical protein